MTTALKKIMGELSGLSVEKQQVAASVIHALWNEEHSDNTIHSEWKTELDRRNDQIQSGEVELLNETSMNTFVENLFKDEA